MGHIPEDAKWYIADLVEELTIEDEAENIVHINTTLIRADSPEEAYERAVTLGRQGEDTYKNPFGKQVKVTFRGLRDLNVVYGKLEHGTELFFDQKDGVSETDFAQLLTEKHNLNVFRPIESDD